MDKPNRWLARLIVRAINDAEELPFGRRTMQASLGNAAHIRMPMSRSGRSRSRRRRPVRSSIKAASAVPFS